MALICDFCGGGPITWREPCSERIVSIDDDWAACDVCHQLVAAHDKAKLAERAATRYGVPLNANSIGILGALFERIFFEHRTGPARPYHGAN